MQIRLQGRNMKDKITQNDPPERRAEPRGTSNKFHSVEMKLSNFNENTLRIMSIFIQIGRQSYRAHRINCKVLQMSTGL